MLVFCSELHQEPLKWQGLKQNFKKKKLFLGRKLRPVQILRNNDKYFGDKSGGAVSDVSRVVPARRPQRPQKNMFSGRMYYKLNFAQPRKTWSYSLLNYIRRNVLFIAKTT